MDGMGTVGTFLKMFLQKRPRNEKSRRYLLPSWKMKKMVLQVRLEKSCLPP